MINLEFERLDDDPATRIRVVRSLVLDMARLISRYRKDYVSTDQQLLAEVSRLIKTEPDISKWSPVTSVPFIDLGELILRLEISAYAEAGVANELFPEELQRRINWFCNAAIAIGGEAEAALESKVKACGLWVQSQAGHLLNGSDPTSFAGTAITALSNLGLPEDAVSDQVRLEIVSFVANQVDRASLPRELVEQVKQWSIDLVIRRPGFRALLLEPAHRIGVDLPEVPRTNDGETRLIAESRTPNIWPTPEPRTSEQLADERADLLLEFLAVRSNVSPVLAEELDRLFSEDPALDESRVFFLAAEELWNLFLANGDKEALGLASRAAFQSYRVRDLRGDPEVERRNAFQLWAKTQLPTLIYKATPTDLLKDAVALYMNAELPPDTGYLRNGLIEAFSAECHGGGQVDNSEGRALFDRYSDVLFSIHQEDPGHKNSSTAWDYLVSSNATDVPKPLAVGEEVAVHQTPDEPEDTAAPSESKPIVAAGEPLLEQGRTAGRQLATLLAFAREDKKKENGALFARASSEPESLNNSEWGTLAFLAGVYSKVSAGKIHTHAQRTAMLNAIAWSVRYEALMRPKHAKQRTKEMLSFVNKEVTAEPGFSDEIDGVLSTLLPDLERPLVEIVRAEITPLGTERLATKIDAILAQMPIKPPSPTEVHSEGPTQKIEGLWQYLDHRYEIQNRRDLEQLQEGITTQSGRRALSKLGNSILGGILYRHSQRPIPIEHLDLAVDLAPDVVLSSQVNFRARAEANGAVLRAIRDTARGRVERENFAEEFVRIAAGDSECWNLLASAVARTLLQLPVEEQTKGTAVDWLHILKGGKDLFSAARKNEFLVAVKRHASESLLIAEFEEIDSAPPTSFMAELLRAYRRLDLAGITQILKDSRTRLIAELSRRLATSKPGFDSILEPRRRLRQPEFDEARRLLRSEQESERRRGGDLFATFVTGRLQPDYRQSAREWMLYSRALVRGRAAVLEEWQKDFASNAASWEEIWNLAGLNLQIRDPAAALEALRPGVVSLRAPYSHLQFALYAALQMIEHGGATKLSVGAAQSFLIDNIQLHPAPECYLVWLLLVDEAEIGVLPQERLKVLEKFERLHEQAPVVPDPGARPDDKEIDAFEKQLSDLGLDKTWLIWINDYAERTGWVRPKSYQRLAEALIGKDVPGARDRAAEALNRAVEAQAAALRRAKNTGRDADPRYIRFSLMNLFNFYKKHFLDDERIKAYRRYSREAPYNQFWDVEDPTNNALVNLTRDLIEGSGASASGITTGGGGGESDNDAYILTALRNVETIESLRVVQERVATWIDSRIRGSSIVKQRANLVKTVMIAVGRLDTVSWSSAELQQESRRLNQELERAVAHVGGMKELRPLQPVVDALRTAYARFIEQAQMRPTVRISVVPPGLPRDESDTSIVVDLENAGPGDLSRVRISCVGDTVKSRSDETIVLSLREGNRTTVSVPLSTDIVNMREDDSVDCQVRLQFDCGVLKGLTAASTVSVPLFDFAAHLNKFRPGAYEIPIPYTEEPIDFARNEPKLFQGRDSYLDEVRSVINGQLKTPPIYYHGVRKVGKSSLLGRIALELRDNGILPLPIKLEGIRAEQQPLPLVINTFTAKIIDALRAAGVYNDKPLEPVRVDEPNPIIAVIGFLRELSNGRGDRRVALLIDEFPNLVAPSATPLLDILRQIDQEQRLLFFFSGWVRPRQLERDCPDTQLFPLAWRAIDFLAPDAVARVLRDPLSDMEITVPDATVALAFALTAGNPHHLAAVAIGALTRINNEHRLCVTPQDLEFTAAWMVKQDRYFRSTIFSQMILARAERDAAIHFAKLLKDRESMPQAEATEQIPAETLEDLREKGIIQPLPGQHLTIRGQLLARYLQDRMAEEPSDPLIRRNTRHVGIFVDMENIRDYIPPGMSWEDVGRRLDRYGASFGDVVCKWASWDPANFHDSASAQMQLERTKFDVAFPKTTRTNENRKDRADFVLIQMIHDEETHRKPDFIIIFSGDHAYAPVATSLLEKDLDVRIVSSVSGIKKLSSDWEEIRLADARRRKINGLDGEKLTIDSDAAQIFAVTA